MNKETPEKLNLLGYFEYHQFKVQLEAKPDETLYTITSWEDKRDLESVKVRTYGEIGPARDDFEGVVDSFINRTSRSMVIGYMQYPNKG